MNQNRSQAVPWTLIAGLGLLFLLSLGYLSYANYAAGSEAWQIALSALLLAVPLGMLYFSIGLFVVAEQQRRSQGEIGARLSRYVYRTPRISAILIILFVSLFALDMFGQNLGFWQTLLGFLMHSLPAIFMAIVLIFAWRWEWVGFVAFLGAAIFFVTFFFSSPLQAVGNFLIFSAPMAAIGLLFWANWKWKKQMHLGGV